MLASRAWELGWGSKRLAPPRGGTRGGGERSGYGGDGGGRGGDTLEGASDEEMADLEDLLSRQGKPNPWARPIDPDGPFIDPDDPAPDNSIPLGGLSELEGRSIFEPCFGEPHRASVLTLFPKFRETRQAITRDAPED